MSFKETPESRTVLWGRHIQNWQKTEQSQSAYCQDQDLNYHRFPELEVEIKPRANSRPICSVCSCKASGYDHLPSRRFEFIPMWGIKVFQYAPRRVNCVRCGIHVEKMPWSKGKRQLTESYAWFLLGWAKRLSWKEVAEVFHTSWDHVFSSVEMAVDRVKVHQAISSHFPCVFQRFYQ